MIIFATQTRHVARFPPGVAAVGSVLIGSGADGSSTISPRFVTRLRLWVGFLCGGWMMGKQEKKGVVNGYVCEGLIGMDELMGL